MRKFIYFVTFIIFILIFNFISLSKDSYNKFLLDIPKDIPEYNSHVFKYIEDSNYSIKNDIKYYIKKLPHKELQLKYAYKYNIPIRIVLIINYIESNFTNVIKSRHNLNYDNSIDWGVLQMNDNYSIGMKCKKAVLNKNYNKYYKYAYLLMRNKYLMADKNKVKTICFWNSLNYNTYTDYIDEFIKRARRNEEYRILRIFYSLN